MNPAESHTARHGAARALPTPLQARIRTEVAQLRAANELAAVQVAAHPLFYAHWHDAKRVARTEPSRIGVLLDADTASEASLRGVVSRYRLRSAGGVSV